MSKIFIFAHITIGDIMFKPAPLHVCICIIVILVVYIFLHREIYLTSSELKEILDDHVIWQGGSNKISYSKYFNKDGSLVVETNLGDDILGVTNGSYKIVNKGGDGHILITYTNIMPSPCKTSRFHPDHKDAYTVNAVMSNGPYKRITSQIISYINDKGHVKCLTLLKRQDVMREQ